MASRNHLIDAARVLAVVTVVVYHTLFFEVNLTDGRIVLTRWVPGEPLLVLGWFVMILPVFFVAAGYGHAASAESRGAGSGSGSRSGPGDDLGRLTRRGSRLAGPIALFVTVLASFATAAAWWPGAPPSLPYPGLDGLGALELATALSRDYADFLWFLVAYLVVVALADPMVRLQERQGVAVPLLLGAGATVVDQVAGVVDIRGANWVLVWLACHQLGVGLRRGWFRRRVLPWVTATTAATGVVVLVGVAGYPLSPIANYYPPSVAIVVLGLAQVSVLALLQRAGVLRDVGAAWQRRLAVAGAHLVTVYLWQAACIILAILVLVSAGRAVPGMAPALLHPSVILVASVTVIVAVVPWIGRVERRLAPSWEAVSVRAGVVGFALLFAGTLLVWQNGAVLHPERPWSTVGVLFVWAAAGIRQRVTPARNMQG
ncbi:MAG: hypothetical protein ACQERF_11375 [Actinomycetota bacterium]